MPQKRRQRRSGETPSQKEPCCARPFLVQVVWFCNIMLWLSGAVMLAVGLWSLLGKGAFTGLLKNEIYDVCVYGVTAIGGVVLGSSILGCVAVGTGNWPLLMLYAVLLLLAFMAEALIGVLAYLYYSTLEQDLNTSLNHTLFHTYPSPGSASEALDNLQMHFKCCGVNTHTDWLNSKWHRDYKHLDVPDSCCINPSYECGESGARGRPHPSNIHYNIGCLDFVGTSLREKLLVMGAVTLGVCALPLFGIIFSCCLSKAIQQHKNQQKTNVLLY